MRIVVCYNETPVLPVRGESIDLISEQGSRLEAEAVFRALRELGYDATVIPLRDNIAEFIRDLQITSCELVFNLCEGFWGDSRREMHVAALLEIMNLTCTGASPVCLGLSQDKVRSKDLFSAHHLPTPAYTLASLGTHQLHIAGMKFPMIVKPRFEDASLGINGASIVSNSRDLHMRVDYVHRTYHQDALVEEFIDGREFNVAIIGNQPTQVLPISEICFDSTLAAGIVSYKGKWLEDSAEFIGTRPVCPAPLSCRQELLLRDVALRAYNLLECRDYARIDIRFRQDVPYLLEVNANPDIGPEAGLARSAAAAGLSYPFLISRLVELALKRKEAANA